jgi:hypothetical protein
MSGSAGPPVLRHWVDPSQLGLVIMTTKNEKEGVASETTTTDEINMSGEDLEGANFKCSDLFEATFYRSKLWEVDFRFADFDGADFAYSDLRKAENLHKAKLPEGWREALEAAGLIPKEDFDERLRGFPYLVQLQNLL